MSLEIIQSEINNENIETQLSEFINEFEEDKTQIERSVHNDNLPPEDSTKEFTVLETLTREENIEDGASSPHGGFCISISDFDVLDNMKISYALPEDFEDFNIEDFTVEKTNIINDNGAVKVSEAELQQGNEITVNDLLQNCENIIIVPVEVINTGEENESIMNLGSAMEEKSQLGNSCSVNIENKKINKKSKAKRKIISKRKSPVIQIDPMSVIDPLSAIDPQLIVHPHSLTSPKPPPSCTIVGSSYSVESLESNQSNSMMNEPKESSVRKRKKKAANSSTKKPKTKKYTCGHCEFSSDDEQTVTDHILNHHLNNISIHRCKECDFTTKSLELLTNHVKIVHKAKDIKCMFCAFTAETKKLITEHINTSHFKCKYCKYTTCNEEMLNNHITTIHFSKCNYCKNLKEVEEDTVIDIETPSHMEVRCTFKCKFSTHCKRALADHIKAMHNRKAAQPIKKKISLFNCQHCEFTTKVRSDLTKHVKERHRYKCLYCEFTSDIKIIVDNHVRSSHVNVCIYCEKIYKSQSALTLHINSKHLKLQCNSCDFRTSDNTVLATHSVNCSVFKCNYCEELFMSEKILSRHVNSKHSKLKIKCHRCEFRTNDKNDLIEHLKNTVHFNRSTVS